MKTALIQCPAFGIDKPPLALGYLAAYVRREGYEVNIFDFNVDLYSKAEEENKKLWEFQYVFQWLETSPFLKEGLVPSIYFKKWAEEIIASEPDVIGFSVQSTSLIASINLAKEIKSTCPNKFIVFGGPLNLAYDIEHAAYLLKIENDAKNRIVDAIVLGEGEETLLEILRRKENKKTLKGCPGTVTIENSRIINNGLRPLIEKLDTIPFPEFYDFPLNKYKKALDLPQHKYKSRMPILGSRGCIHRCIFCDDTLMWRHYRYRSAQNIVAEMKLRKKEGIEDLDFNDLLINGNLKQLSEFCDLLIKEKYNMFWGGSACINIQMDLNFLKKLKAAGCGYLNYGIESASPKMLRDMRKGFTIDEAQKIIEETYKAGIEVCSNWIVGFPTETYEDFKETLSFIRNNIKYLKNNIMVNSFILKTSSVLYDNKEKFGIVLNNERNWLSQNSINTIEERKRRYDEFIELVSRLGDKPVHETFQK